MVDTEPVHDFDVDERMEDEEKVDQTIPQLYCVY